MIPPTARRLLKRKIVKKLMVATALALAFAAPAYADIIDPLHSVVCSSGGTACVNTDNNDFAPTTQDTNLGFEISPPNSNSGTLTLAIMVPTNLIDVTTFSLGTLKDNGVAIPSGDISKIAGLFNTGDGSSLAAFLGLPNAGLYSPTDNFSNASAGEIDPSKGPVVNAGFGGDFLTFTVTLPGITLDAQGSATIANDFSFGTNIPVGTVIAGFFATLDGQGNPEFVGTAASEDLVLTQQFSAVPAPIVGAGIPGIIAGSLTLLGLGRYRRKRLAAA
jgi:hypothetical protein